MRPIKTDRAYFNHRVAYLVLSGLSCRQVAADLDLFQADVRTRVHRHCLNANPFLYESLLTLASSFPTLESLRLHFSEFFVGGSNYSELSSEKFSELSGQKCELSSDTRTLPRNSAVNIQFGTA